MCLDCEFLSGRRGQLFKMSWIASMNGATIYSDNLLQLAYAEQHYKMKFSLMQLRPDMTDDQAEHWLKG